MSVSKRKMNTCVGSKIPKQLVVGGHIIPVKQLKGEGDSTYAYYDHLNREICIRPTHPVKSVKEEALLHEILECVTHIYNISLSHDNLTTLSELLYHALKQNSLRF